MWVGEEVEEVGKGVDEGEVEVLVMGGGWRGLG